MKSCTPLSHISLITGKAECFFLCLFLTFAASFIFFMFWVFFHALVSFDFSFCSEKVHYRLSSHIPPICDCVFNVYYVCMCVFNINLSHFFSVPLSGEFFSLPLPFFSVNKGIEKAFVKSCGNRFLYGVLWLHLGYFGED